MSEAQDLELKLKTEQADYLKRLENSGRLPTVISEAWNAVDQGGTAKLRTEEADLLKNYGLAASTAREASRDIWDPFVRDKAAAEGMAQAYAPIADVRKELAMRAESLGIATASATAMYGAETNRAQTNLGFTESAYNRAYAREQEATRQRERQDDIARAAAAAAAKSSSGGSGSAKKETKSSISADLQSDISDNFEYWVNAKMSPREGWTESTLLKALYEHYLPLGMTRAEINKMVYDTRKPYEDEGYF